MYLEMNRREEFEGKKLRSINFRVTEEQLTILVQLKQHYRANSLGHTLRLVIEDMATLVLPVPASEREEN